MFQTKEQARFYLAGVIDGEGHISQRKHKSKEHGYTREVRITNTDEGLLSASRAALDMLGVKHRTYDRSERARLGTKPIFDIVVWGKENLELLVEHVPLQTEKGDKLKAVVGSYMRKNRPPDETLRTLFLTDMTDKKIAERYGVTPGAVWFWRKRIMEETA